MKHYIYLYLGITFCILSLIQCSSSSSQDKQAVSAFPYIKPELKPDRPLSAALQRNYDDYMGDCPETNELYSQFKYTELKGFDYSNGDGTISRRDPSKVIFANGKFYMWYTHRQTPVPPVSMLRANESNDTIPSADWDLSDIYYATSEDGFTREEQGIAVARPEPPKLGCRSVATADILFFKGKYYLYYQAFNVAPGKDGGDYCPVAVSYADSPDGPWISTHKAVVPKGNEGEWDQYNIHDPYPLVHDGKNIPLLQISIRSKRKRERIGDAWFSYRYKPAGAFH